MKCVHCGSEIAPGSTACTVCGGPQPQEAIVMAEAVGGNPFAHTGGVYPRVPAADALGENAASRMLLPVGRSWLAIVAGYLGLFSVLALPAPVALLFGILAIRDIRRNPEKHGMGRAIFGVVMGTLGSILLAFALVGLLAGGHR